MNTPEIENDETVNCEALTIKLISSAKGKISEHESRDCSCSLQSGDKHSARKSSHAGRLCHQSSSSKSYFEISYFPLLDILKVSPGLSL